MAQPDDAIPCKDCRAYKAQYDAWWTYSVNGPELWWLTDTDVLPKPPRLPRKPHLIRGKTTPGDRCTTHWRAERNRKRVAGHARRLKSVYTLSIDEYRELKAFQGGKCAICQRATGESKNLAVDHDHTCCAGKTSCGECVRGLLCGPCNSMLAHMRDDRVSFDRASRYLAIPPYTLMKIGSEWA